MYERECNCKWCMCVTWRRRSASIVSIQQMSGTSPSLKTWYLPATQRDRYSWKRRDYIQLHLDDKRGRQTPDQCVQTHKPRRSPTEVVPGQTVIGRGQRYTTCVMQGSHTEAVIESSKKSLAIKAVTVFTALFALCKAMHSASIPNML